MELRSGQVLQTEERKDNSNVGGQTDENSNKNEGQSSRMLTVMFIGLLLDLLAFTMILPLLPALLEYYAQHDQGGLYSTLNRAVQGFRLVVGAPDTPRWNSVLFGGLIGSLFSFLQFLASPILGAASDVYGRRPILLLCMCGIALSHGVWAVSHSFSLFVLARIIGGLSKGNISLSTAIVADVLPPTKRGRGMALVGIAFSVGFLLGPLIGAYFSKQARLHEAGAFYVTPALFAVSLSVLAVLFLAIYFKETLPAERRVKSLGSGLGEALSYINPASLFKFKAVKDLSPEDRVSVRRLGLVYFLYLFFYSGLEFTLTFLTHNRFSYDSLQQGKMFFVIGIVMILVQGGYVRRIHPSREIPIAKKAIIALVPAFLLVGVAYHQALLYAGLLLFAFASAVVIPCLTSQISVFGSVEQKGVVMGIFRSLGALARALGPVFACTVYWSVGPVVCYTVGALALVWPLVLLSRLKTHSA